MGSLMWLQQGDRDATLLLYLSQASALLANDVPSAFCRNQHLCLLIAWTFCRSGALHLICPIVSRPLCSPPVRPISTQEVENQALSGDHVLQWPCDAARAHLSRFLLPKLKRDLGLLPNMSQRRSGFADDGATCLLRYPTDCSHGDQLVLIDPRNVACLECGIVDQLLASNDSRWRPDADNTAVRIVVARAHGEPTASLGGELLDRSPSLADDGTTQLTRND
mmetsp:Transcript_118453/g.307767  ORF Transcript_118453/g.307767 Transcript_118453/m.307767 type:complete len:222 (-) Transcript_118453:978-1643(-)